MILFQFFLMRKKLWIFCSRLFTAVPRSQVFPPWPPWLRRPPVEPRSLVGSSGGRTLVDRGGPGRTKGWTGEPRRAGRQRRGASRRVPSLPLPREPPSVAPTPPNCPTNLRCLISYRSVNSELSFFFLHIKHFTGFKMSFICLIFSSIVGLPKLHCWGYVPTVEVWNR